MRAIVIAAALMAGLCDPGFAYDAQTMNGQAVCDTLAQLEELSIAIGMKDDQYIEEMGSKGCHFPEPGLKVSLIEAYADQTVLLFRKLAERTQLGPVPENIGDLTNLAKVRLYYRDREPAVGFTLLRVPHSPTGGATGAWRTELNCGRGPPLPSPTVLPKPHSPKPYSSAY